LGRIRDRGVGSYPRVPTVRRFTEVKGGMGILTTISNTRLLYVQLEEEKHLKRDNAKKGAFRKRRRARLGQETKVLGNGRRKKGERTFPGGI